MNQPNPILRIWQMGESQHKSLIFSIVSAICGVALGMLPYFSAANIIVGLLNGTRTLSFYMDWLALALAGYAARTLLYSLALIKSHKATFSILKTIRQKILAKLPNLPLGMVVDMSSGKMKQIIVDMVESMETTLAHLLPEHTTTAIIGPSGSGKTTLCNLIARFWDVDRGSIKIGGIDIRDYTLEALMDQLSVVFQTVYLFADTVENNIKFGKPNTTHAMTLSWLYPMASIQ